MLIGADNFLRRVVDCRQVWLRGIMGSGKTLGAVAIADELVRSGVGLGVVSNIPHALPAHPWRDAYVDDDGEADGKPNGIRRAILLFDEPWLELDARSSMQNPREYGGFSRKLGCVYLLPSVHIIDSRLRAVQAERTFRFKVPVLHFVVRLLCSLPLVGGRLFERIGWLSDEVWIYKWQYVQADKAIDEGRFLLTAPSSYFGVYDTKYIPLDDAGISSLYHWTIAQVGEEEDDEAQWWRSLVAVGPDGEASPVSGADPAKVRAISKRLSGAAKAS